MGAHCYCLVPVCVTNLARALPACFAQVLHLKRALEEADKTIAALRAGKA